MKLSVITINYNRKADLQSTIESVAVQSFREFEYIVIDGGSSDGSLEVIQKYKSVIAQWVSEADKGIFDAMNNGIRRAKGEYLLFINGGDTFLHANALQEAMTYLNACTEDIVYGNILVEMPYGGYLKFHYPDKLYFRFFIEHDLPHQATFIRRKLFDTIGLYDINNHINADWAFFILAICKYRVSYRHIPCIFTCYQKGGITQSMRKMERIKAQEPFLEQHFGMFYRDIFAYVRIRQRSLKARGYKLLALFGSFILSIYFSLGGKPFKFLEELKRSDNH